MAEEPGRYSGSDIEVGGNTMGLFDLVKEIGDNIYAEVALATAEPASDETMREVYDYWGLDKEDKEPFRVIKFDLNYGHDNAMKVVELAGDFYKYKAEGKTHEEIADILQVPVEDIKLTEKALMDYGMYKMQQDKDQ